MSANVPCICAQRFAPVEQREWVVTMRNCNQSAFNGYRVVYSDYSEVRCLRCHGVWRTKAAYVAKLKDVS